MLNNSPRGAWAFMLVFFAALAFYPLIAGNFGIDLASKIMIYAIFALSLEILVGRTGLISFGHAALFGIGAYTAVLLSKDASAAPNLILLLLASILASAAYALFMGALSLRTKGAYFIMVTLAFAQMAYYIVHDTPLGGGTDGVYLMFKPVLGAQTDGSAWIDLAQGQTLYYVIWLSLLLCFGFLAVLLRSRFGHALAGIHSNEQRMQAVGFSTYWYKLAAFVVSGAVAGWAGFLFAVKDGYVNPEMLSWHLSGAVLIMIILGGLGHLRGALLGAFAFALLQELFKSEAIFGEAAKHWQFGLGIVIIASVVWLPKGLMGLPNLLYAKLTGVKPVAGDDASAPDLPEESLA